MGVEDILYDDEQQLYSELVQEEYDVLRYVREANEQQAQIMDDIVAFAPNAPGDLVFPLAMEVQQGTMSLEDATQMAVDSVQYMGQKTIERQPEPKNWWDKLTSAGHEAIKATTKWGVAGLEFVPQALTNVVSRQYQGLQAGVDQIPGQDGFGYGDYEAPSKGVFDGFFASTDLGALLSGAESGNGYFIGEAAKEFQEENARAYRGTIDGEAWTLGRGWANTFFNPDSQAYNITSGLIDAAAAIAVPSLPGSKAITRTARAGGRVVGKADEAAAATERVLRAGRGMVALPGSRRARLAGVTYSSRPHIDRSSVGRWLDSRQGRAVKERLAAVDSIEEAKDIFRNADADFWLRVVEAKTSGKLGEASDEVGELLKDRLGLEGLSRVDDIRVGRMADRSRARLGIQDSKSILGNLLPGRVKEGYRSWWARNFAPVAGREMVVVSDDIRDLTQTIENASNYLRTLRVGAAERDQILRTMTRALLTRGVDGNIQDAMKSLDDVVIRELSLKRVNRQARKRIVAGQATAEDTAALAVQEKFHRDVFGKFRNEVGEYDLFGTIDESGNTAVIKGLNFTQDGAVIVDAKGDLVSATAHIPSEMRKFAGYMPDARAVRRASARYKFMWENWSKNPDKWGDPNLLTAMMDKIQQDIWRPATLMTGGYMFRNMIESVIRSMATPGIKTGPFHPLQWMRAVSRRTFAGDVNGVGFAENARYAGRRTQLEFIEATNAKPREAVDIIDVEKAGFRSGHYRLIARPRQAKENMDYAKGVANELRLMANTPLGRIAADVMELGGSREEAVDIMRRWLTGEVDTDADFVFRYGTRPGQGKEELKRINTLWQNKRIVRSDTGEEVRGSINFIDEAGNVDMENLTVYLNDVIIDRLEKITGGNNSLLSMVANPFRGTFTDELGEVKPSFRDGTGIGSLDVDSFDYSDEMIYEIGRLVDEGAELPQLVKAPVPVDQVMFGKSDNPLGKAWRKTIDHFFGNVFGKKEAFLNRSPVFRKYYYLRIADLSDEITQETASEIMNNIYRGTFDLQERRVMALESLAGRRKQKPKLSQPKRAKEQFDRLNAAKRDADGNFVVGRGGSRRVLTADERQIEMQNLQDRVIYKGKEMSRAEADALIEADMPALTWNGRQITDEEYDELLTQARKELEEAKGKFTDRYAERYVGSKELWKLLKERANGIGVPVGDAPKLTTDQLDIAAKAFALEETKSVFFNAADKNNFADILRIAVPFGPAWAEMTKLYYKQVLLKPNRVKNMGVSAQGFRDMDPDGDGKGFIYTDPNGELVFNYPFSDWMIPFVTAGAGAVLGETLLGRASPIRGAVAGAAILGTAGLLAREQISENLGDIKPELVAPVRSLSMSFQVMPGFGPAVQIPAKEWLGNKPQYDQLMELISPFGTEEVGLRMIAPAWLEKVYEAVSADPDNDRIYLDLKMDAYRALYTSGDYDNTSEEDMARLDEDANSVAAYLLAYRGLAQYLGPVRGNIQFNIPTDFDGTITVEDKQYDIEADYIPNTLLSATFRAMQEQDYENAVVDFLRTFGPDMMMYTVGKTRSTVEGLDASAQFGDWERNNPDILRTHKDVYGYFAPIGTEFDMQTYLRQIEQGSREKIKDPAEIRQDAEAVVGKALYMDAVRQLPDKLSEAAQIELALYRDMLEDKLPGFEFAPINIRERAQIIDQVINAARSPLLDGNEVAEPARLYIDYREQVLAEAILRNNGVEKQGMLGRTSNADLRRVLRQYGDQLASKYPEFQRVWTRVFYDEVDV